MPRIAIRNRSGVGLIVETGASDNQGNWTNQNNNQTQSLQPREATTRTPAGGHFRVTAAPVGLPAGGTTWFGAAADIDLFIVSGANNLQVVFQDPG